MAYVQRFASSGTLYIIPPALVFHHSHGEGLVRAVTARNRRRHARRVANTVGGRYRLTDVAERDQHTCHLCGKRVDMALSGLDPMGPTADHLVPVSCGGGDEPHNVALAHRRCNVKRGVGGVVQLRAL